MSGRRTTLAWQRRRMICDNCGKWFLEDHRAFAGALTARLARRLVADVAVTTVAAAARRHGLSWHVVMALVRSGWQEAPQEFHGLYTSGNRQGGLEALGRFCDLLRDRRLKGPPPSRVDSHTRGPRSPNAIRVTTERYFA